MTTRSTAFALVRRTAVAGVLLAHAGLVSAQTPAAPGAQGTTALPKAAELIARYIAASGSEAALANRTSARMRGQFSVSGAGLTGDLEILQSRPNKSLLRISVPGLGEMLQGYDGTTGWATDPMRGPRLLAGKELDTVREEADFGTSSRRGAHVASTETVEKTEMNGEACYRVKIVWRSGRETFDCYSVASGLMVASVSRQESPMGAVEVTSLLSDYKDFGGQKVATRVTQQIMGQQQVLSVSTVEYDVVDAAAFDLPAPIRALTEKKP